MDPERVSPAGSGPTGIQSVVPSSHFAPQRDVSLSGTVPLGGTARSEVPSSRSSMVDSASEMSESDTDAMSLSGKFIRNITVQGLIRNFLESQSPLRNGFFFQNNSFSQMSRFKIRETPLRNGFRSKMST